MSTEFESPVFAIDEAAPSPTTTHYQQLADEFMQALDRVAAMVPKLESKHVSTANFVRSHMNIRNAFLMTAIVAVEQIPELRMIDRLDVDGGRDTLQFIEAFRPVQDRLMALTNSLKFTMAARKARLASDALQVYSLAKGLARDPTRAEIAAHVANLKRDLGRRGPVRRVRSTAPGGTDARDGNIVQVQSAAVS